MRRPAIAPRLPDWRSRLSALVAAALQRPFEWGVNDCALFAADAILAMTGTDPARDWRGRYASAREARALMRARGYADKGVLLASILPEVPLSRADAGDIAILGVGDDLPVAVITGPLLAAPGPTGLRFAPRPAMVRAFHVPFAGEPN
jgi:hypothetical protein